MPAWSADRQVDINGRFQLVITKPGGKAVDATFFRGVPTRIESYSNADPFGDASMVLTFPKITGYDDLMGTDVGSWLADFSNVDLYWVPAQAGSDEINPLTNQKTLTTSRTRDSRTWQTEPSYDNRQRVWEGFIASMDITMGERESSLQVQCQGALFQLDRYLQKPFYPPRPWPLEKLIADSFRHRTKPHLRTKQLRIIWPAGWAKTVPAYNGQPNLYTPQATPGEKYTGYTSRSTGSWDHTLTGFVQDQLAVMWTDEESGVTPGNQWTILHADEREPVLTVRDRFRPPDFSVWFGQPGITMRVTRDTTQMANLVYGEGTGLDGSAWRNANISSDGSRTDYLPLASSPTVYPASQDKFDKTQFVTESFLNFGSGFQLDQAITSAKKTLARDLDPGWAGTMTLKFDPPGMNRFRLRAGMTVQVLGFAGTGEHGMNFHVAEVDVLPETGDVTLKIDTRYRDLLNLEEAQARTRDPLTPSKMLQVNRRSVLIEDIMAPWDYTAGSGFIPKASKRFHAHRPNTQGFPWAAWLKEFPPRHHPEFYVKVNAHKQKREARWTLGKNVPILTSEKGTIRRTEVVCVDWYGNVVKIPFHFSIYYVNVTPRAMPKDASGPSPFITGAFESLAPTGEPWPAGNFLAPDPSMVIGWGNLEQPAGYSPRRLTDGSSPTGLLVDESAWTYDNTNNPNFDRNAKLGQTQPASAITLYGAFYAEHTSPVYFIGRLYRQEPGT